MKTIFAPVKKVFPFIMAFLVLSFSFLPCADGATPEDETPCSLAGTTADDEPHDDACSPFCICTCCAGFSLTTIAIAPLPFIASYNTSHSSFIAARTNSIASSVWQPPN
ncbi:MAG TPA: DUF6660 family protein [Flavisolibacter sp.]|nr:DUF6660 family protein [Flavisolibacter sp.]